MSRSAYTVSMSIFATIEQPTKPKTKNVKSIAILYAGILVVFSVAQLFNFNEFQLLIQSFWLPGGAPLAYFLSGFIIVAEVFALPFLLNMRTSSLMRMTSMVLGWVAAAFWLFMSVWVQLTTNAISNIGFLGTTVSLTPGWWTVLFSVALVILTMWASWGMWPRVRSAKK